MSQSGPPADAKQAQAAALAELEAAQRKKRAIDTSLVSPLPTVLIGKPRNSNLQF